MIMLVKIAIMVALMCSVILSEKPLKHTSQDLPEKMMSYMIRYGYLDRSSSSSYSGEEMTNVIRTVQRMSNVPQTSVLDDAMTRVIERRRRDVTDAPLFRKLTGSRRQRRYTINRIAKPWDKSPITWRLDRSSKKVNRSLILQDLERAFRLWSDASSFRFQRLDDHRATSGQEEADIVISFEAGEHGDGFKFDGPGTILAHAFPPAGSRDIGGDMHMDEDEDWKTHDDAMNSGTGVSIVEVAVHELGHSLGLDHSHDRNALMYFLFLGNRDHQSLPEDDRRGIQALYGENKKKTESALGPTTHGPYKPTPGPRRPPWRPLPSKPNRPTSPRARPNLCHTDFDTIAVIRGEIYAFKDEYMWRFTKSNIDGPRLTASVWLGLPKDITRIDAVYEEHSGTHGITFFSGTNYWVFDDHRVRPGYPQQLTSLGLSSNVTQLDAVLEGGHNGDTTFFRQNLYWKYDETEGKVKPGYPKGIRDWKGVRYPLTSALRWIDGAVYFFRGKLFWKFDAIKNQANQLRGKLTSFHWFHCPKNPSITVQRKNARNIQGVPLMHPIFS